MADVRTLIAVAEQYPAAPAELPPIPDYVDEERPEVKPGWQIGSLDEADWALARMGELEEQIAEIEKEARLAVARIEARAEKLKGALARGVSFFEAHLAEYATRERATLLGKAKKKSRTFLHGVVGFRSKNKGGKLRWVDEKLTLEWAKARPVEEGLYRCRYELEKRAVEEFSKREKVIPPGCALEPETDEPYVKTAREEE